MMKVLHEICLMNGDNSRETDKLIQQLNMSFVALCSNWGMSTVPEIEATDNCEWCFQVVGLLYTFTPSIGLMSVSWGRHRERQTVVKHMLEQPTRCFAGQNTLSRKMNRM